MRTLQQLAQSVGVSYRTILTWKSEGMPGRSGAYDVAAVQQWAAERGKGKSPAAAADPQRRELLNAKLAADVKYRIAKAQAAERGQARANREYADDALAMLAEWIVPWKAQIQSWVSQALLVIPEEHRPEVKRLLEAKVDRLLEDMAKVIA